MKHALLVATVVIMVSGVASAEIPQVLGYQGRITDNSGVPVADGTYAARFRIYDDETAGALLWDSNDDSVVVAAGAFSVMLGESPQPTLSLAFDEDYWLLVTFDGEDQTPRKRLGSVGYAYMASGIVPGTEMVDSRNNPILKGTNLGTGAGLRGDSEQGDGVRGQSSATDGKGVYGISTATTGQTYGGSFESSSSTYGRGVFAWAKGTTGQAVGVYGVSSSPSGYAILGEADATTGTNYGVYGKTNSSSGYGVLGEAVATTGTDYGVYGKTNSTDGYGGYFDGRGYFSGNVGIGTTAPNAALDVRGSAIFNEDGADSDFRVEGDTKQNLIFVDASSDRVGIGTGTPNAMLDVRGSAVFNEGGADSDFRVEGDTSENLIFVDASENRVGIRTDTPAVPLHVNGTARFNKVGIGTDNPVAPLEVRGDIAIRSPGGNPRSELLGHDNYPGSVVTYGPNGNLNFRAWWNPDNFNHGAVCVLDGSQAPQAGMEVDESGDGIVWGDTKNFRMANPNQPDTEIWYACIEGPEAAAYLRGTARLENGRASVSFPDHFQAVATAEGMTVQLTPLSAECKGLAVTEKTLEGIEVQELWNGTGSYDFDYLVMAVRQGYEDYQVIRPDMEEEPTEPRPTPGT